MLYVYLIAVLFAGARIGLTPSKTTAFDTFKDFAHLFTGGLIGVWLYGHGETNADQCGALALGLSCVEIVCALPKIIAAAKAIKKG